jgi:hypothetical protein
MQDYPGRGIPDAADESNIEYRDTPGYPLFVVWRADAEHDKPMKVVIGVHTIKADRINAMLIKEREAIQAAANAVYKPGDTEIVLFAPAAFSPIA